MNDTFILSSFKWSTYIDNLAGTTSDTRELEGFTVDEDSKGSLDLNTHAVAFAVELVNGN